MFVQIYQRENTYIFLNNNLIHIIKYEENIVKISN